MGLISTLDRKLLRDLVLIRGQAIAIALVIAAGVSMYVLMLSTFDSLDLTQRTYYDRYRFADVFASLRRAPLRLEPELERIPGVARAQTRVVVDVTLDVEGLSEPAVGRLISIPEQRRPILCDLFLRKGRYIEPGRSDEVLASEAFALAHGLEPGDTVVALINGRQRELRIVGFALTPEYVYTIRPGELLPDDRRFGIFWMERRALASAFDMEGGFNDVVLRLARGADERAVISRLDRLLEPYGGLGAIPRRLQVSHWYLNNELQQLRNFGAMIPIVFLAVAAFLLNVVLSRIISVQREQIAVIKAVGYSNAAVAGHYLKWGLIISLAGWAVGVGAGAWLGHGMTVMYTDFFDFPILAYRLLGETLVASLAISAVAAVLGTLAAVHRAVALPPAEAMRPEPPGAFRESWVERTGLKWLFSQPTRMIVRSLQRHPGRTLVSLVGIASGTGLLIFGSFSMDSMAVMVDSQFNLAQRYDIMVSFVEPASARAIHEIRHLPGVLDAEPFRAVPVRLRFGHRSRNLAIIGLPSDARLNRIIDASDAALQLPPEGLVLSAKLAEILGLSAGDTLLVEVLEGRRPVRRVPVAGLVNDYMGTNAYMELGALQRLMREAGSLSGAYLLVDPAAEDQLYEDLKATPAVAGVALKRAAIESFHETMGEMVGTVRLVNVIFAVIIAFGVVYNSARISLSERSRELATLRVIGFNRTEVSYILLGELMLISLAALPLGMLIGYSLAAVLVHAFDTEVWRLPLAISTQTYAFSALTVALATAASSLIVRRKLDRLDLVETLKTRE